MGLPPRRDLLPRSGRGPWGEACQLARKLDGSRGGPCELFRECSLSVYSDLPRGLIWASTPQACEPSEPRHGNPPRSPRLSA